MGERPYDSQSMSPLAYRRIALTSLVAACITVVTGAAVRLTGSGLGCADWPNCNNTRLVDVSTTHGAIEQVNRLFTFVIGLVVVIAVVIGALRRAPKRRDLVVIAILIALGWPMQGLVGAIVVLTHLNPFANQQHFLLSMVLVGLGTVLLGRASEPDGGQRRRAVSQRTAMHVRAITGLTIIALLSGTFVTGAGPHAGDEKAKRFDVAITSVARIHSIVVLTVIGVVILLMWRLRTMNADRTVLDAPLMTWMVLAISQAAVGYTQYFSGVPAALVAIHIALATGLWVATVRLQLAVVGVSREDLPASPPATAPGAAAPVASA